MPTRDSGELCQWDAAQPEGRRCTPKPVLEDLFALFFGSCLAQSYAFPAPEGLGPPNSAVDCEAVAPWCKYEELNAGNKCTPENDETLAAMDAAVVATPTEVLPPPGPTPAATPATSTSSADLAAISLAAGLVGLAVALA